MRIPHFSFHISISHEMRKLMLAALFSSVLTTGVVFGVLWAFRARLVAYIVRHVESAAPTQVATKVGAVSISPAAEEALKKTEGQGGSKSVETAVAAANPAVVSIVIKKDFPVYKTTYENVSPLDGFTISLPRQTQVGTEKKVVGSGSGFIVSSDGYIVTNRHVVEDTDATYTVTLANGKEYAGTVLARDAVLDIAIVKIAGSGFSKLELGDSDSLKLGQSVIAIGNALGQFQNTVSVGIISGLSRSIVASGGGSSELLDKVIQTDAAINPGNSGGPLLDLDGRAVGVNVAVAQGSQSIGFSIPINSIKSIISSVRTTGSIVRPYLGVRYADVTADIAASKGLSVNYGVLVTKGDDGSAAVDPGSPADKAGIVENDVILSFDGVNMDEKHDLAFLIRGKKVGQSVTLGVLRNNKEIELHATLAKAKAQ